MFGRAAIEIGHPYGCPSSILLNHFQQSLPQIHYQMIRSWMGHLQTIFDLAAWQRWCDFPNAILEIAEQQHIHE